MQYIGLLKHHRYFLKNCKIGEKRRYFFIKNVWIIADVLFSFLIEILENELLYVSNSLKRYLEWMHFRHQFFEIITFFMNFFVTLTMSFLSFQFSIHSDVSIDKLERWYLCVYICFLFLSFLKALVYLFSRLNCSLPIKTDNRCKIVINGIYKEKQKQSANSISGEKSNCIKVALNYLYTLMIMRRKFLKEKNNRNLNLKLKNLKLLQDFYFFYLYIKSLKC